MAYERLHGPLGQGRDDHLAALIAATVRNTFAGQGETATLEDFLPDWTTRVDEEAQPYGDDP